MSFSLLSFSHSSYFESMCYVTLVRLRSLFDQKLALLTLKILMLTSTI